MKEKTAKDIWQKLRAYEGDVLGYLKGAVGDGEIAKDLFQEVYLSALQHLKKLDETRSLKAWLMTVARNRVLNFFRDTSRRTFISVNEGTLTTESAAQTYEEEALRYALQHLPERQRQVLLKRELEGMSYESLAAAMNLTPAGVTSLLKRARENLKRQYRLYFLPAWVRDNAHRLPVDDLLRFVQRDGAANDVLFEVQKKSQRYFSRVRRQWDALHERFFPEEQLNRIFSRLGHLQKARVLDAGSGSGMVALKATLRAKEVVAVDLNARMISHLRALREDLALTSLKIVRCDLRRLSFKKGSFDVIFAALVLHHLPRPEVWLKEAARTLRRGGNLVVVDFDRHGNKELADIMHDLWLGFPPHLVQRWARQAGLRLVHQQNWQSSEGIPVYAQVYKR